MSNFFPRLPPKATKMQPEEDGRFYEEIGPLSGNYGMIDPVTSKKIDDILVVVRSIEKHVSFAYHPPRPPKTPTTPEKPAPKPEVNLG